MKSAPNLVIYQDVVLFSAGPGEAVSISIKDGKTLWAGSHGATGHQSTFDLLVADGLVWSTSGGRVRKGQASHAEAIKLARKPRWTYIGRDPVSGEVKKVFPPGRSDWFPHRCHRGRAHPPATPALTSSGPIARRTADPRADLLSIWQGKPLPPPSAIRF